jgi:cell division protein FtsI/penicillin-binding protein 2
MRQGVALFIAAVAVAGSLPWLREHDDALFALLGKAKLAVTGGGGAQGKKIDPPALTGIDLTSMDERREVVTAPAHGKRNADLTLDPYYQRAASTMLRQGRVHEGAVVMTEVATGRVLVWASYNAGRPRDLCVEATAPSASIFKIVTGAGLVEQGASLSEQFCYSGGERRLTRRELEPDEQRDRYCASLGMALGRSLNTIFGRLAVKFLDPAKLGGVAGRLGYGLDIPFDVPVQASKLTVPEGDDLELARTAAGFWNSTLSPFQAVNLALTVANGGEMIRQHVVERVVDEDGEVIYQRPKERQVLKRALDERTAWAVARMMEHTVRDGTSFASFHDRAGRPFLPDIDVAGKTGTLEESKTSTLYTWWVGFAPARKPEVALGVLVLNRGSWHVKATHLGADMLRVYFADQGREAVRMPPGFKPRRKPAATAAASGAAAASAAPSATPPAGSTVPDDDEQEDQ